MIATTNASLHGLRTSFRLLAAAALAATVVAGGPAAAQSGRDGTPQPERIVSLGGDATEILYALGLGDSIVAVDSTSVAPPEALKTKASVGYMRQLSAEGVLSTGATVIVANAEAGPPEVVNALKAAKLSFVALPGNEAPDNVADKVRIVGRAFGREAEARKLAWQVESGIASLAERRKRIDKPVRALFVLSVNNGRAMVGGTGTTADTMLKLSGAVNAAGEVAGYKPLTSEALLGLAPDVVLTMRRDGATDVRGQIQSLVGYRQSPAGRADRLIEMDAHYLLGGPRTHEAAAYLMSRLYPALAE